MSSCVTHPPGAEQLEQFCRHLDLISQIFIISGKEDALGSLSGLLSTPKVLSCYVLLYIYLFMNSTAFKYCHNNNYA